MKNYLTKYILIVSDFIRWKVTSQWRSLYIKLCLYFSLYPYKKFLKGIIAQVDLNIF